MTISEKIQALNEYLDEYWEDEVSEAIWCRLCQCISDEERAVVFDLYCDAMDRGYL